MSSILDRLKDALGEDAVLTGPAVSTRAVSLPFRDMAEHVQTVKTSLERHWPTSRLYVLGHIGDGNLHLFVSPGIEAVNLHREVDEVVYTPLAAIGGSISAEHGIGLEKREHLRLCRGLEEVEMMRAIKRILDPKNLLNPGEVLLVP